MELLISIEVNGDEFTSVSCWATCIIRSFYLRRADLLWSISPSLFVTGPFSISDVLNVGYWLLEITLPQLNIFSTLALTILRCPMFFCRLITDSNEWKVFKMDESVRVRVPMLVDVLPPLLMNLNILDPTPDWQLVSFSTRVQLAVVTAATFLLTASIRQHLYFLPAHASPFINATLSILSTTTLTSSSAALVLNENYPAALLYTFTFSVALVKHL